MAGFSSCSAHLILTHCIRGELIQLEKYTHYQTDDLMKTQFFFFF